MPQLTRVTPYSTGCSKRRALRTSTSALIPLTSWTACRFLRDRKNNLSGALPIVDLRPAFSWIDRACSQEHHDAPCCADKQVFPVFSLPGPALAGAGTVSHNVALRCGTELGIEQVVIPCAQVCVGFRRHSSIIWTCIDTPWVRVGTPRARPTISLRNITWCSRSWYIDGRISTKNSPGGRPHRSGTFQV